MHTTISLLALVGVLATCGRGAPQEPSPTTIDPATFAAVLGELAVARIEALPDTTLYRQRRSEILERAGVTEQDLREFAAARGGDPDVMSEVYERVGASIDSHAQR
ncbi:MAG: hypothetical protein ACREMK_00985 [Gemmatimonadota bacterium]